MFTYHLITPNDAAQVKNLAIRCWGNGIAAQIEEEFKQFHSSTFPKIWIGIRHNDELVAMGTGLNNFACEHIFDLGWLCTAPEVRGKGLAKNLSALCALWWNTACRGSTPHLMLSCTDEHSQLYASWGFEVVYHHRPGYAIMIGSTKNVLATTGRDLAWARQMPWDVNPFMVSA